MLLLFSLEFIDIAYFRELHADACNKLEQLCEVWEGKAAELEQDQDTDHINKEEGGHLIHCVGVFLTTLHCVCVCVVLGQMRTTCCQARLLMRQKLNQYIGLVDMAENNSGAKKTTREDLQVCCATREMRLPL